MADINLGSPGLHQLRVQVGDRAGNLAPETIFPVFVDQSAPRITHLSPISPNLRTTPVESIEVTLTEPVWGAGLWPGEIRLFRNGALVTDASALTVTPVSATGFRFSGLAAFTAEPGTYRLEVRASAFMDLAGNRGEALNAATWTVVEQMPTGFAGVCFEDLDGDAVKDDGEPVPANPVVFPDTDQDGLWDEGEPALPGWTVLVDFNENGLRDLNEPSQQSGADGTFRFTSLRPGMVRLGVEVQDHWSRTTPEIPTGSPAGRPSVCRSAAWNSEASAGSNLKTWMATGPLIPASPVWRHGASFWT